jgi:hypothetical protein
MMAIFIAGAVIIIACVLLDEFLEAYDEWQDSQEDDDEF